MAGIILNNLPFDDSDLTDATRHQALGLFMTAWSQVEVTWSFIFRKFLDLQPYVSTVVSDKVTIVTQLSIVRELAEFLSSEPQRELARQLFADVEKLSAKRNKIVHSSWGLFNGEPARFDHALTSNMLSEISEETETGKRQRANRIFNLHDLKAATDEAISLQSRLGEALHTFTPEPGPWGREMAERDAERERRLSEMRKMMERHRPG